MNRRNKFYVGAGAGALVALWFQSGYSNPSLLLVMFTAAVFGVLAVALYPEPARED